MNMSLYNNKFPSAYKILICHGLWSLVAIQFAIILKRYDNDLIFLEFEKMWRNFGTNEIEI